MKIADDTDIKIRILLAAKKLIAKQGYDGTTIRQICDEASANVALVSYHFGGKENLYNALFETFIPNDRISSVDRELHPVLGVKLIIREVSMFRFSDPEIISIIQQEIVMNSPRIELIRQHVMPMWRLLQKWVGEGREQGYFHFRSLDTTFMSIVGALLFHRHQKYWIEINVEKLPDIESLIEDLTDFIMNGLHYRDE
ncbi:TetR/AcrR family transcriptional regulator [Paenibacillus sp. L3-i20]|uniref:TetR/AcrR family transcriptional regulator n=1 Tax=Paenibacillus sp. L3-i20 TaxID=2905833 RepID=UPI001EE11892|nr:TetR/AcrR family transcriptional regulator [Paenibacillus sp. L3-i20]GKU76219.1 TetR family transcriptional regulator [Paenibacillus sp. L3-i20]